MTSLFLINLIVLSGCGKAQSDIFDTDGQKIEYEINDVEQSIVVNNDNYLYREEMGKIVFVYPNNIEISVTGDMDTMMTSGDVQLVEGYLAPEILFQIYSTANVTFPFVNILVVFIGGVIALLPKACWCVAYGWIFGMKENTLAIRITRVCGVFIFIVGIFL